MILELEKYFSLSEQLNDLATEWLFWCSSGRLRDGSDVMQGVQLSSMLVSGLSGTDM